MDVLKDGNDLMSRLRHSEHSNCALTIKAYSDIGGESPRVLILVLYTEAERLSSRHCPGLVGS